MKDITLINDIINGEIDKFEFIMNRYHDELFKYIYNMSGNVADTQDLLQEIFIKVYGNLERYDASRASFRTWLYRITTNHIRNHLKSSYYRHKTSSLSYNDSVTKSNINIENKITKEKQIEEIVSVMKTILNPKHLKIMMLHYFSQLTVTEISEIMDIPQKTIYKAINSSIKKIQKEVNVSNEN